MVGLSANVTSALCGCLAESVIQTTATFLRDLNRFSTFHNVRGLKHIIIVKSGIRRA